MGRSRGGLTTKIHALVDANGNPIVLKLSAGQAHDGRSAADMLATIGAGQVLLADRAYDSDKLDAELKEQGIEMIAPHRSNRTRPATQDGRSLRRYKRRWKQRAIWTPPW